MRKPVFQIVQVPQSRRWLRCVHDNMGVDGDRKVSKEATVQHGKVHARRDAMSDFASSLTWRCLVLVRRVAMSDFASSLTWYSFGVVDGDRKVSMDYGPARNIHARRDAMSGFLFVLTWVGDCKTYLDGCYGAVCRNPCTEKCDVGVLFVFTWVVDRKKNFETSCAAVLML